MMKVEKNFPTRRSPFSCRGVALAVFLLAAMISARADAQDSHIGWHSDLNRAAQIAAKTNKPIFLVFRCVR